MDPSSVVSVPPNGLGGNDGSLLPQPSSSCGRGTKDKNDDYDDDDNDDDGGVKEQQPQQQPQQQSLYRYVRHEEIESTFFPGSTLKVGTLCWVLLSKGKHKSSQLYLRARVLSDNPRNDDDDHNVIDGNSSSSHQQRQEQQQQSTVDDTSRRILVQYPAGSTYHVRRSNLLPVLEVEHNIVMVASETTDYRRLAIVHTRKDDHFFEIGCDFGILVDSVDAASSLGVDKSEESILGAQQRYPNRNFVVGDVFDESDLDRIKTAIMTMTMTMTTTTSKRQPLVVAIDINGNRELPAVLRCIQLVMDTWSPRLVIVKSRELYAAMMPQNGSQNDGDANE